jgi:hypothetical protein
MKNLVLLTFFLLISVRLFADVAKDMSSQSNIDYVLYSIAAFAFAFLIWIYIRERKKE